MCSDVQNKVGTLHIKMCSDVHTRAGTPHIKIGSGVQNRKCSDYTLVLLRVSIWSVDRTRGPDKTSDFK